MFMNFKTVFFKNWESKCEVIKTSSAPKKTKALHKYSRCDFFLIISVLPSINTIETNIQK